MSTETIPNGRAGRKSLASQLDRLDGILDGLSEALQGAVADAVKESLGPAVRDAVRDAVVAAVQAVLTDPDLRDRAAAVPTPEPEPAKATMPLGRAVSRVGAAARTALYCVAGKVRGGLATMARTAGLALRLRRPLGLAVGVGAAVGVACYLAGPQLAAAVSGAAGFAASLTASGLRAVRRALPGTAPLTR